MTHRNFKIFQPSKRITILLSIAFMVVLMGIALISASPGTYKQGEDIRLTQTCSDCTYINITSITSPNGNQIIGNVPMTKDGSVFNYTLNGSYTNDLGTYKVNGIGNPAGVNEVWVYKIEVTPSGSIFTTSLALPVFLPMILMGILALFFFFMIGFTVKKEYKFTFIILGGIFIVFALAYGIIASRDILYGFPLLYGFVNSFYRIFIISLQIGAIVIPITVAFFVIKRAFNTRGYFIK